MMVRLTPDANEPFEIVGPSQGVYADNQVLIDFGLCSTAQYAENFAVDLYVLERAFISTHPQSENLYAGVLEAYSKTLGEKKWKPIQLKLKEGAESSSFRVTCANLPQFGLGVESEI